MIALLGLRNLFFEQAKLPETDNQNLVSINHNSCHQTCTVVVFSHHRDLKVALDELDQAGFSNDWITLITRNTQHCSWCQELIAKNFDPEQFNFSQVAQRLFWKLFQRGKYLVLLSGNNNDVDAASKIMARRQNYAKVWRFE